MALRKDINGKMKGHQWEGERTSMGKAFPINPLLTSPYQGAEFSYTLMQMAGNDIPRRRSMV